MSQNTDGINIVEVKKKKLNNEMLTGGRKKIKFILKYINNKKLYQQNIEVEKNYRD